MEITIVKAGVSDVDMLAPLFDLYRQFYKKTSDLASARQFLTDRLTSSESVIFYAKFESMTVGLIQLYPTFSSLSMGKTWILNDLFVSKDARGMGVGKALLQAAERFAKDSGAFGITLETGKDNPAKYLYQSLGWTMDKDYDRYYIETRRSNI